MANYYELRPEDISAGDARCNPSRARSTHGINYKITYPLVVFGAGCIESIGKQCSWKRNARDLILGDNHMSIHDVKDVRPLINPMSKLQWSKDQK